MSLHADYTYVPACRLHWRECVHVQIPQCLQCLKLADQLQTNKQKKKEQGRYLGSLRITQIKCVWKLPLHI